MGSPKYTKDECIKLLLSIQESIGYNIPITQKILIENKIFKTVLTHWGSMTNMKNELHLPVSNRRVIKPYTDDELMDAVNNFVKTYGFFPSSEYWGNNSSRLHLPSLAVYNRHFGSWHEVRSMCLNKKSYYEPDTNGVYKSIFDDKQYLINILHQYYNENNRPPTQKQLMQKYNYDMTKYITKHFGNYRNYLDAGGYYQSTKLKYTDDELEKFFMDFVKENNRVPTLREFNENPLLPSCKSYTNRFGSWGKACRFYGFKPNERQPKYYLDNGEICDSSYECKVSIWLRDNNISYGRNIPYKDIDIDYNGSMNCDYLIHGNKNWYVEIAGMLWSKEYVPTSSETILYHKKLKRKEQILRRNNLDYRIIYACEFKNGDIGEILKFIKEE